MNDVETNLTETLEFISLILDSFNENYKEKKMRTRGDKNRHVKIFYRFIVQTLTYFHQRKFFLLLN